MLATLRETILANAGVPRKRRHLGLLIPICRHLESSGVYYTCWASESIVVDLCFAQCSDATQRAAGPLLSKALLGSCMMALKDPVE